MPFTLLTSVFSSSTENLDYGYNKKAIQEADKVLKKHPNCHCAKALKALALARHGRHNECAEIVETFVGNVPPDDGTLQAITLCYKELNQSKFFNVEWYAAIWFSSLFPLDYGYEVGKYFL
jgi:N-terminal acetyltransferase B complex non-catalytic subunit